MKYIFTILLLSHLEALAGATHTRRRKVSSTADSGRRLGPVEPLGGIVGGAPAAVGEFPTFVQYGDENCGAVLIHEDIVLSAAHCGTPCNCRVFIKGNATRSLDSQYTRNIVSYIEHPSYDREQNDFLLMKLDRAVNLRPATYNTDISNPAEGSGAQLTAVGYGSTCAGCTGTNVLMKVDVNYVDHSRCNAAYGGLNSNLHLCASASGRDTCQGDSGGPLYDSSKNNVVGITSFGIGCASPVFPGVYARVSGVKNWIEESICCLSDNRPSTCPNNLQCPTIRDTCTSYCSDSICFSSVATVITKDKGRVAMKDIEVGQYVLTASGQYKKIFTNLHSHNSRPTSFLQIHTTFDDDSPLEVTSKHLVFLSGKWNPMPASQVKTGDYVETIDGTHQVTKITTITRNGHYNPLTVDGTIVVDGVFASAFSSFNSEQDFIEIAGVKLMSQQTFSTMAYTPYRLICGSLPVKDCDTLDPAYSRLGRDLVALWQNQNVILQFVAFVGFVSIFGFIYILTSTSVLTVLLASLTWYSTSNQKQHVTTNDKLEM